jgi:hypothetical protein
VLSEVASLTSDICVRRIGKVLEVILGTMENNNCHFKFGDDKP